MDALNMGQFTRIKNKFKYDNKLRLVLDGIAVLGVKISPHILYIESADFNKAYAERQRAKFTDYEISFFTKEDIEEIAKIPRPRSNKEMLLKRLADGHRCLGIKKNGKIAAFSWYNLKEAKWQKTPLLDNQAYLFDMYTLNEFRGLGLASFIRYKIYEELEKLGRNQFLSYSAYFNHSSIRFKEKLFAKKDKLILHLNLFHVWVRVFMLKKYSISEE